LKIGFRQFASVCSNSGFPQQWPKLSVNQLTNLSPKLEPLFGGSILELVHLKDSVLSWQHFSYTTLKILKPLIRKNIVKICGGSVEDRGQSGKSE